MREAPESEKIEKAEFVYRRHFMGMEHNYLCAVCREASAVIDCGTGILEPCWSCQKRGYHIVKLGWFGRLLRKYP